MIASNAVKNSVGFIVTLAATLVFIVLYGLVAWVPGLVMAFGNVDWGSRGGATCDQKRAIGSFSVFLVVVMVCTGVKMLFDAFRLIQRGVCERNGTRVSFM